MKTLLLIIFILVILSKLFASFQFIIQEKMIQNFVTNLEWNCWENSQLTSQVYIIYVFLFFSITFLKYFYLLLVSLIDLHLGFNRPLSFGLKFGRMEIIATATNDTNGQNYQTTFNIETED